MSSSRLNRIYEVMNKRRVKGFYNYVSASSLRDGALALLQTTGLGKLRPNTILLGFKTDWETAEFQHVEDYVNIIQ